MEYGGLKVKVYDGKKSHGLVSMLYFRDGCRFVRPAAFVSKTCSEQHTLFGVHRCSLIAHQDGDKQEAFTDRPGRSMDCALCLSRVRQDSITEGMCREHVATSKML